MKLMKDMVLNTSVQQQNIMWGQDERIIPMVPGNYWTEMRLHPFTTHATKTVQETFL